MDDRSEGDGTSVAIVAVLVLLVLTVGGAGLLFFFRQAAMLRREAHRALAAEREAREQAELARTIARIADEDAQLQFGRAAGESAGRAAAEPAAARTPAEAVVAPEVRGVLHAQQAAWNAGDIDAFMAHYWNSENLTFSTAGKTTRGWRDTLNRYRERYPDAKTMGQLRFQGLEIIPLGESSTLVLGEWQVDRDPQPLRGNFSLVMRNIDGRWLIIHDHTSRLDGPAAEAKASGDRGSQDRPDE